MSGAEQDGIVSEMVTLADSYGGCEVSLTTFLRPLSREKNRPRPIAIIKIDKGYC